MTQEYGFELRTTKEEDNSKFLLNLMTKYLVQLVKIEPRKMPKGDAYIFHFVVMQGKKYNS